MTKHEPDPNTDNSNKTGVTKAAASFTAGELIAWLEGQELPEVRRRDLISSVNRICEIGGVSPPHFVMTAASVRALIAKVQPAGHRVSEKTWANLRSNLTAALMMVGLIDGNLQGIAKTDPVWGPLQQSLAGDKGLSNGLARFMNYCSWKGVRAEAVDDGVVRDYHAWLEARTLVVSPLLHARRVPGLWNKAVKLVACWPQQKLMPFEFDRKPRKTAWVDLPERFRREAENYLAMREKPDIFGDAENPNLPSKPLAKSTLRLQREHIRLAFHVLAEAGQPPASLVELVERESFITILRHYFDMDTHEPNAFAIGIGKTVIAIARIHVQVTDDELKELKRLLLKLPAIPFDLTEKNKALLRHFDDERTLGALYGLVDTLLEESRMRLAADHPYFYVPAHAGLAIAILLIAPLRAKNLRSLNWSQHFHVTGGKRGRVRLIIPKGETKTKKIDCVLILDDWVVTRLTWYRRTVLPAMGADPNGDLFAMPNGSRRSDGGFGDLITRAIKNALGVHMTRHQFRHLAAKLYLDQHPEDFETIRQLLGHAFSKTTQIYAGLSGERASKAYGAIIAEQRERVMKLAALRGHKPKPKPQGRKE